MSVKKTFAPIATLLVSGMPVYGQAPASSDRTIEGGATQQQFAAPNLAAWTFNTGYEFAPQAIVVEKEFAHGDFKLKKGDVFFPLQSGDVVVVHNKDVLIKGAKGTQLSDTQIGYLVNLAKDAKDALKSEKAEAKKERNAYYRDQIPDFMANGWPEELRTPYDNYMLNLNTGIFGFGFGVVPLFVVGPTFFVEGWRHNSWNNGDWHNGPRHGGHNGVSGHPGGGIAPPVHRGPDGHQDVQHFTGANSSAIHAKEFSFPANNAGSTKNFAFNPNRNYTFSPHNRSQATYTPSTMHNHMQGSPANLGVHRNGGYAAAQQTVRRGNPAAQRPVARSNPSGASHGKH